MPVPSGNYIRVVAAENCHTRCLCCTGSPQSVLDELYLEPKGTRSQALRLESVSIDSKVPKALDAAAECKFIRAAAAENVDRFVL